MKKVAQTLEELTNNPIINENDNLKKTFDLIRVRAEDNEFKIAVVGEFSSGKSTFINALIGKDILKHATVETTATVTYIRNVKQSDELCGKYKINYSDGKIKWLDSYNNLKEYTTTMSSEDVVSSIESVEVFIHFTDAAAELTIIDTPGLNGIADKHREVTIEEIKRAHACIYIFPKNGVSKSDEEFIKFLCNYQNTFIFVQNFIDELRKSEGDSVENKLNAVKSYLQKSIFINEEFNIEYSIYGISALKALAGKDSNITKLYDGDLFDLTAEQRKKHLEDSKFKDIENKIISLANSEKIKDIKHKSVCRTLVNLLQDIIIREKRVQESNNQILQEDDAYKDKEKAIKLRNNIKNRKDKIVTKLDNFVIAQFARNKQLLDEDIENKIKSIEEIINNFIDSEIDYEDFSEKYKNGVYTNELQRLIDLYKEELEKSEYYSFQDVYKNMLNRLSEYSRYSTKKIKSLNNIDFVETQVKKVDLSFREKRKEIEELKKKLADNEANNQIAKENLQELNINFVDRMSEYNNKNSKLQNIDIEKAKEESKLGSRPQKYIEGYDIDETYVDRDGILGGVAQFLIGKKKVTKSIPRYNDSKGLDWDRKRRSIALRYQNEKEQLYKDLELLKDKQARFQSRIEANKLSLENSEGQIKYLKNQILVKEEELRTYETKAKKEYLRTIKDHLKKDINRYLFDENDPSKSIVGILKDKVKEDINKNKRNVQKEIKTECKRYITEEIERLNTVINGNVEELNKKYISKEKYIKHLETVCKSLGEEL